MHRLIDHPSDHPADHPTHHPTHRRTEHPTERPDLEAASLQRLHEHFVQHRRWFVLTGAGLSTASGIPDYRDHNGAWKRNPPVTVQAFVGDAATRARYWARSMIGWPRIDAARPNDAHQALADLQREGRLTQLVTQNVDGLHQRAGSRAVIDLHGQLDAVVCLACGTRSARAAMQALLAAHNPQWQAVVARSLASSATTAVHSDGAPTGATMATVAADGDPIGASAATAATAPDGDVDIESDAFGQFIVPPCSLCGGMLKPDVVFFGENVPRPRVEAAQAALLQADAMLVAGSSLMVFSGFRFAREAAERGMPVIALNLGRTRADALLTDKITLPCDQALSALVAQLKKSDPQPT